MSSPVRPWECPNGLQNSAHFTRNQNGAPLLPQGRSVAPVVPPRPLGSPLAASGFSTTQNSLMPYSYSGYGGPSSYTSYGGSPYSSIYGSSYGGYNTYGPGSYGSNYGMFGQLQDSDRRYLQYIEESSRNTFASVESLVRAFSSVAMMLDNTFFAMTSSFRAILGVAENFGKLRSTFGQIWYSVNIFRLFSWLYRKIRQLLGLTVPKSNTSLAWNEAGGAALSQVKPTGSSWSTLAFLGVIVSAPYIISKFMPKYEDKTDPATWRAPGIRAKACFDFVPTSPNELNIQTNDNLILAPTYVQEEMNLKNTGWALAIKNGKSGVVPLNYILIDKSSNLKSENNNMPVPIPRACNSKMEKENNSVKTHTKRVSFGDIQFFENDDEIFTKKKVESESKPIDLVENNKIMDSKVESRDISSGSVVSGI